MKVSLMEQGPRRVLFVIGSLHIGGTEKQILELASRLDRKRFQPEICCLASGGELQGEARRRGIPVTVIGLSGARRPSKWWRIPACLRSLLSHIRRSRPHVVHASLFWSYALATPLARFSRVPAVIASRRGVESIALGKAPLFFLQRFLSRCSHLTLTNSDFLRQEVIRKDRISSRRVRVIRNGIDLDAFDKAATANVIGLPSGRRIITVANINAYKISGYLTLVEAAAKVLREEPEARFLVVGDGPERGRLEGTVAKNGLQTQFHFLGSRNDVASLLVNAEVKVFPSTGESFPNAPLEAMAARLPVIASRVGGVPEMVEEGATGVLVPPGDPDALADAILWMLSHPQEGREMGIRGRIRVTEQFSMTQMVEETEKLYEELLAETRRITG